MAGRVPRHVLKGSKMPRRAAQSCCVQGTALVYEIQKKKKNPLKLSHCPEGRESNSSISVNGMIYLLVAQTGLLRLFSLPGQKNPISCFVSSNASYTHFLFPTCTTILI